MTACASAPEPAPTPPPSTYAEDAAFALARQLAVTFGYDNLPEVAQLNFRRTFWAGDDAVFSAEHHWDLVNDRDRIVWTADGHEYDAVLQLETGVVYGYVDGVEAIGEAQLRLAREARRRFAVDTHYIVLPMRMFDPRAHLVLSRGERVDGQTFEVLELLPESEAGQIVRLYVDPVGLRVHRSEVASGPDPHTRRVAQWGEYKPVGPLLLAHEHRLPGGDRRTRLEDVSALRHVDHTALVPRPAR